MNQFHVCQELMLIRHQVLYLFINSRGLLVASSAVDGAPASRRLIHFLQAILFFSKRFARITISFMKGVIFMTYKQIEASRELRLWIGQVIVPAIGVSVALLANPGVRQAVNEKAKAIKAKLSRKKRLSR